MALYYGHQVQIDTPAGLTEPITLTCEVLHGDTCAPYLFMLCLDYVLSEIYGFTYEHDRAVDIQQRQSQTLTLLMTLPYSLSPSLGPRRCSWMLKGMLALLG